MRKGGEKNDKKIYRKKKQFKKMVAKQVYECVNKNVLYYIAFVLLASGIFVSVGGLFSTITGPGSISTRSSG